LQSADRYQILGLSREEIKLFEGNRDALDEIEVCVRAPVSLKERVQNVPKET
ncbi:MAG: hypothetical protein IMZ71_05220, partial [Chloroflexi bacterium]|nr:hypothetical protein [Chloroflexota bacterium]